MRISLQELLVIHPFCLHSSVVWFIHGSVMLSYLMVKVERNIALLHYTQPKKLPSELNCHDVLAQAEEETRCVHWGCSWQQGLDGGEANVSKRLQSPLSYIQMQTSGIQVLAPQIPDILRTASSGWPLSLSGLLFYSFLDLSHLSFICISQ